MLESIESFGIFEQERGMYSGSDNFTLSPTHLTTMTSMFLPSGNNGSLNAPDFCSSPVVDVKTISYSIGMLLILLISVVGNTFVLVAMAMSANLRQRVTTLFIMSLACSDMCFAMLQIPFKVSVMLHNGFFCHAMGACYWYLMSDIIVNVASIFNLFLIAIDRLVQLFMLSCSFNCKIEKFSTSIMK